jgi:IMP cyclohydrolase
MQELCKLLKGNPYPGRGILLGSAPKDGQLNAVIAYFIMGRSENSRNRVFEETADGIRTRAFDESKMQDPSLIIYHPVRMVGTTTVVTNGDQTDTIRDALVSGGDYISALRTREFEPDDPNYTPRISGIVNRDGGYALSILKRRDDQCCRQFFEYQARAQRGHFISTYQTDGDPLPSFAGEPVHVSITAPTAAALAEELWDSLDGDNKVSLFVRYIDLRNGFPETVIINKHGGTTHLEPKTPIWNKEG